MPKLPALAVLLLGLCLAIGPARAAEPVLIGLDAEFGHRTSTSATAVRQGIEIAIDEINRAGGVLGGRPLKLVTRDNRSITAVGVDNLRELAALPDLVAVFGGKFSPIYVESVPAAHQLGVLLMNPWGSADGIIDHGFQPSYTFRLSLRDEWAAPAFIRFAREQHKASRVGVLLPSTAWGRSNRAALEKAVAAPAAGVTIVGQRWYNWGDTSLIAQYQALRAAGAQVIVLVANETEGAILVREVAALPPAERLPIVSHWGVTGGDFAAMCGDALDTLDFAVIQTYSFIGQNGPVARRILEALKTRYGIASASQIRSPVGVAHAYDLTHLLAMAIRKAGSADRRRVRDALERLGPYDGLVQRYPVPFTPERHEALSARNIFFARYNSNDELIPIRASSPGKPAP
jgi:branched-chain amino acid transport system substrate-binding protein